MFRFSFIEETDCSIENSTTGLAYRQSDSTFFLVDWKRKSIEEFSFPSNKFSTNEMKFQRQINPDFLVEPISVALFNLHSNSLLVCDNNILFIIDQQTGKLIRRIDPNFYSIKTIKSFAVGLNDEIFIADHRIHSISYEGKYLRQIVPDQTENFGDFHFSNTPPDLIASHQRLNCLESHEKLTERTISSNKRGFYTALTVDRNGLLLAGKCRRDGTALIEIYDQQDNLLRIIDSHSQILRRPCSLATTNDGCLFCLDFTSNTVRKYRYT